MRASTLQKHNLVSSSNSHLFLTNGNVFLGALVYLLDLFCNSSNPEVRSKAADLFNKMMADKLVGPKVKITLAKFLPTIFMDAMRENPEVSVHMFEGLLCSLFLSFSH